MNFYGNPSNFQEQNQDFLLHKNLDVTSNFFLNNLEREINQLPTGLQLAKEFIYYKLIPNVESMIKELETLKQTTNYDDNIPYISVTTSTETEAVSAIDCFSTHNIKGKMFNRMIYGTGKGDIYIHDFDTNRTIVEKKVYSSRVEIIRSSTVKYYDTFLSRIIVACRGCSDLFIYNFNHSQAIMTLEETISMDSYVMYLNPNIQINEKKDAKAAKDQPPENKSLAVLPCSVTVSKDSFFLVVSNFEASSLVFKFGDIPNSSDRTVKKISDEVYKLISVVTAPKQENFSLLQTQLPQDDNSKKDKKSVPSKKEDPKDKGKNSIRQGAKNDKVSEGNQEELDNTKYNIKAVYNNSKVDVSALQPRPDNFQFADFIQKKTVFEDPETAGFSSVVITTGIYFSFHNYSTIKYLNLTDHVSKQMKAVFKISKVKGNNPISEEEMFNMRSKVTKQEKEFYTYLKNKVETLNILNTNNPNPNPIGLALSTQPKPKDPKAVPTTSNELGKCFDFSIISKVSCQSYPKLSGLKFNYLGIGLKNGSILIWDTELHCDKFLLETKNSVEVTHITINSQYVMSASIDGNVFIYELMSGKMVYQANNNPYMNYPIKEVSG